MSNWISVNDRLPNDEVDVLIWAIFPDMENYYIGWYDVTVKEWYIYDSEEAFTVDFWMTIEPPTN